MKQWIASIAYFISLFVLIPLGNIINKIIYNYYFNLYGKIDEWNVYFNKVNVLQRYTYIIIFILIIIIYIWNIVSSIKQIKCGNIKKMINQTLIVQIVSFIACVLVLIMVILGTLISSMNIIGALIGLPIFYFFSFILISMINFIGSLRGITSIIAIKKNNIINSNKIYLYGILEFIPFINIIVSIIIKEKIRAK